MVRFDPGQAKSEAAQMRRLAAQQECSQHVCRYSSCLSAHTFLSKFHPIQFEQMAILLLLCACGQKSYFIFWVNL